MILLPNIGYRLQSNNARAAVMVPALCLAAISLVVSGCSHSSSTSASDDSFRCVRPSSPLALALGDRSNDANPNAELASVSPLISSVANAGQQVTLIRVDGSPKVYYQQTFSTTAGNSGAKKTALAAFISQLGNAIAHHARAAVPQADLLTALNKAALATQPGGNVVLIDSGLQTVAPLDFRNSNLIDATPSDVVSFLRKQGFLPDLTGRRVLLIGFGNIAAPQQPLDPPQQKSLIAIWTAIAKAGGAACVSVDTNPDDRPEVTGAPPVGSVALPKPPRIHACGTTILNADNHVNFVPNTAEFIDPAGAKATLQQLADKLQNGGQRVELIGTTATAGTPDGRKILSEQRANAVKQVLVDLGIVASRIHTKGVGTNWHGHVPDIGSNGNGSPDRPKKTER